MWTLGIPHFSCIVCCCRVSVRLVSIFRGLAFLGFERDFKFRISRPAFDPNAKEDSRWLSIPVTLIENKARWPAQTTQEAEYRRSVPRWALDACLHFLSDSFSGTMPIAQSYYNFIRERCSDTSVYPAVSGQGIFKIVMCDKIRSDECDSVFKLRYLSLWTHWLMGAVVIRVILWHWD